MNLHANTGYRPSTTLLNGALPKQSFALTTTTQSLNQIAWHIGYENTYHFSKLFQRHVGCSPSEYRRRFGKSSGEHPDEASED
nr:helix-turn-helix domain-containing protein [Sutterella wadsworthensis]